MAVQTRYILGDAGYSSVTGFGHDAPTHVQSEAASCPQPPIQCNAVSAELSPNPNPNTMYGALVEGPIYTDTFQVVLHTLSLHYCTLHASGRGSAHCTVVAEKAHSICNIWLFCVPPQQLDSASQLFSYYSSGKNGLR